MKASARSDLQGRDAADDTNLDWSLDSDDAVIDTP
jgi:hypothetical protein